MTAAPIEWTNLSPEEVRVLEGLSAGARAKLDLAYQRTSPWASCRVVWDDLLSDSERDSVGGNLDAAWRRRGTLGIWMDVRGFTDRFAALTDLAKTLEVLPKTDLARLEGETSLAVASDASVGSQPVWEPRLGVLSFQGRSIRKVRLSSPPTNVQRILNAFQNANWPSAIDNPLGTDQQQLHDAVYQLNESLDSIRFHGADGGRTVTWEESVSDS